MTVSSTTAKSQYTGNGVTTGFGTGFSFFAASDLVVTLFDTAAGTAVAPAPVLNGAATYDYTVSGAVDPATGEIAPCNVVFNTAPLGNHRVTIARSVAATQSVALQDNAKFPAATVNGALDRLTMLVQQLQAAFAQVLQMPSSDPIALSGVLPSSAARASMYAAYDASGNPIAAAAPIGNTVVSAALVPVVQAATVALALAALGGASLAGNTFTAAQLLKSTTAGAAVETFLTLLRDHGAGAANDFLEAIAFDGKSSTNVERSFARIVAQIVTATNAAEVGRLVLRVLSGGAEVDALTIGPGLQVGAPTGGDKGAGSANLQTLFLQGVAVTPVLNKSYDSGNQTITLAGALTLAHGLGAKPKVVSCFLVNLTAEGGYSIGDEVLVNPAQNDVGGAGARGTSIVSDATNINVRIGSGTVQAFAIFHKTTGASFAITNTNWAFFLRAYA